MHKTINHKVLDDLNWHILEELQRDGRLPTAEIGRRVGLSAPAVADRIQKLEEQGYIRGYRTVLDLDRLGLSIRAYIFFKANQVRHAEMTALIGSIPEIIDWHTVTGNYSVLLKVVTASSGRLAAVIERLEEFGETNTSLILADKPEHTVIGKDFSE
ncbi:MAG TPA: Lrp/AsnC family transcriptional regulator [Puia sp.]|jgi:Lrp/AsnC family leucine-responsive transcriptional regulator|nr:Lrp/AsnC family transcriptional regulator [Puia sp.]